MNTHRYCTATTSLLIKFIFRFLYQGPTGTEGLFTTSARATTKVLRDNSSALLTVLSAVVSDPLYKWNINMTDPTKYRQEEENAPGIAENQNDAATRAIGRINEKLEQELFPRLLTLRERLVRPEFILFQLNNL